MKFGIMFDTHVDKWELIHFAEELGFHRAWVPDSQMIWSDCYATLALAAANTERILLGTGITVPATRIAPVTAQAIGSINQLAPGRVFLGMGTGNTAMRLLGHPSAPPGELREYIRVVRALLDGEAVDFTFRGKTEEIQFMHRDRHYINLDHRIPIYVAANGPKALRLAGEAADGWITGGGFDEESIARELAQVRGAAAERKRELPDDFIRCCTISACILHPGETLRDQRVIDQTGSMVTVNLHHVYEFWEQNGRDDHMIPPFFADLWEDFSKLVASLPTKSRFRYLHDGHATFLREEERRFVTPEAIRGSCIVGEPDEVVEQVRGLERAGINEVALLPPADHQRDVYRDIAEHVMPHF
jgi:alkanesulfonate monooxygenase SsuD/methylene tetrahydromethanopterin reductase-like flavin-dependent oxidoreductase (luciferase family)